MATVADRIVWHLRAAGVSHIFGVPGGGSNLDLVEAARRAEMPFVLTATETGAALAAMAQAEISMCPGVCLTTLGPGVASVVNGVACAALDRVPLVVVTDNHSPAAGACEHQRLDHRALLAPVTKWSATLHDECVESTLVEALARAVASPAGPVHLDCPGEVLSRQVSGPVPVAGDAEAGSRAFRSEASSTQSMTDGWAVFTSLCRRARRPLLLIGLGARRPADALAIRTLSELRRIPAMVTYKAKGVIADGDNWFGGVFTNGVIERPLVEQADLLIGIGLDPVELIPRPWTFLAPIVSCAASRMDDSHVPFATQLVGELGEILPELQASLEVSMWDQAAVRAFLSAQRTAVATDASELSPSQVVAIAAAQLAKSALVTVDAGAHMFPVTVGWPVVQPNQMLISNGLSTMGFALPAAIGTAVMDRTRPVIALTGDGGLLMCLGELATAARERLQIMVVVFADEALSLIEVKQRQRRLQSAGVKLAPISWASVAAGFGALGLKATTGHEFCDALTRAAAHRGPSVIEAKIDGSVYSPTLKAVRG